MAGMETEISRLKHKDVKISDEEDIDWLGELFDKDVDVTDL